MNLAAKINTVYTEKNIKCHGFIVHTFLRVLYNSSVSQLFFLIVFHFEVILTEHGLI